MPTAPPSLCTAPGCGELVYDGGRCPICRKQARRESAQRRPNTYDARWAAFAKQYLRDHPMCECDECVVLPEWRRPVATEVDHIDGRGPEGPRGYDTSNCAAMSKSHHSRKTVRQDGGFGRPKANG